MNNHLSSSYNQVNDYGQLVDIKPSSKELYYIGVLSPNQKNNDGEIYSYNSREIDSLSDKYDEVFRDGYYNRTLYNHRGQLPVGEIYMGCRNDNNDFCTFGRIGGETYAGRKAIIGVVDGSMQGLSAGLSTHTVTDNSSVLPIVEPKSRTFIEGSVTGDPCYDDITYIKYYSDEPGYLLEKIANLVDVDNGDPTRNIQRLPESLQALPEIMREQIRRGKRFVLPQEQRTHASSTFPQGRQKQGGKSAVANMRDFFSLVAQKGRNPDGSVNLDAVDHFFVHDPNIQRGGIVDRAVRTRHNQFGATFIGHPGASGDIETFLDGTENKEVRAMGDAFDHVEALMKSTGASLLAQGLKKQNSQLQQQQQQPTNPVSTNKSKPGQLPPVKRTVFNTVVKDDATTERTVTKGGLANSINTALAQKEQISQEQYDKELGAAQEQFMQALGKFSEENESDTATALDWFKASMQSNEAFEESKKVKGFEELAGVFSTMQSVMKNKPAVSTENVNTTASKGFGKLPIFNSSSQSGGGKSTLPGKSSLPHQAEPQPLKNGVTVPVIAGEESEEEEDNDDSMKTDDNEGQDAADSMASAEEQQPTEKLKKKDDAMDEVEPETEDAENGQKEGENSAKSKNTHQKNPLKKQQQPTTASSKKPKSQVASKSAAKSTTTTTSSTKKTAASAAPKSETAVGSSKKMTKNGVDESEVASFFKELDDPEAFKLYGLGASLVKKYGAKSDKDLVDIVSRQKAMEIENTEMKKQLAEVAKEKQLNQQRAEIKGKNEKTWSKIEGILGDVEDVISNPNGPLSREQLSHLSEMEKAKDTGSRIISVDDLETVMDIHTTASKWKAQAGDQAMQESKLKAKNNMAKKLKKSTQDFDAMVEEGVKERIKSSPFLQDKSSSRQNPPSSSRSPLGNDRAQKPKSTMPQRQSLNEDLHMEKVRPRGNPNSTRRHDSFDDSDRPSEAIFRNSGNEQSNAFKEAAALFGKDPSHFTQSYGSSGQLLTMGDVYTTASKYMPDEDDGTVHWDELLAMAQDPAIGGLSAEELKQSCERMLRVTAHPETYALGGYTTSMKGVEFA